MKKLFIAALVLIMGCNLFAQEGTPVKVEAMKVEKITELTPDGLDTREVAYKYYTGFGQADKKAAAIDYAQRDAINKISNVISVAVKNAAAGKQLSVDGKVLDAIARSWSQVSETLIQGMEPVGEIEYVFNSQTGMYDVTAKMGMRGDRFLQQLGELKKQVLEAPLPAGLNADERRNLIEANQEISDAVDKWFGVQ